MEQYLLDLDLPPADDAPQLARQALAARLGQILSESELIDAQIIASELVTNAVQHGHGPIALRVQATQHELIVQVEDHRGQAAAALAEQPSKALVRQLFASAGARWGTDAAAAWACVSIAG
ncbi:MAG: Histidine kinaselike ATPase domain [Solirubrobacterales bacterium]|nr:Histidine kinaselike ATPase domain [Solirubrobacterales bacterium]